MILALLYLLKSLSKAWIINAPLKFLKNQRAVEIFEDVLTGIYFEYEPMGGERKKWAGHRTHSTGESYYEFIQELKRGG
jgi:hypothetical protein